MKMKPNQQRQHIQYDIIGDVHGRWDKLKPLLAKLGYKHNGQSYAHPDGRVALFLGDLIDPKGDVPNDVRKVLMTVRDMMDAGHHTQGDRLTTRMGNNVCFRRKLGLV